MVSYGDSVRPVDQYKDYSDKGEDVKDNDETSATISCDICGITFSQAGQLARHERSVHTSSRPFVCPDCDAKFTRGYNLKRHRKRLHDYTSDDNNTSTSRDDITSTSRDDITSTSRDVRRSVSPAVESRELLKLGPGGIRAFQEAFEFARPPSPPSPIGSGLANNSAHRLATPTDQELIASERRHFERHVPRGTTGEELVRMRSDWHQRLAILHLKEGTKALRRLHRVYGAKKNPDEE
ncbi:hypothetical protein HBI12_047690 [Parastagonospora nodorum]|nr:hypothetical protein HBI12_047690 [Parastagonospora nodorum]KAH5438160.1 hypothetical protein HBI47_059870 [Parastagonospora nodorum]